MSEIEFLSIEIKKKISPNLDSSFFERSRHEGGRAGTGQGSDGREGGAEDRDRQVGDENSG